MLMLINRFLFIFFISLSSLLNSQNETLILTPNGDLDITIDCQTIVLGSEVILERADLCGGSILIVEEMTGDTQLKTEEKSATFLFEKEGVYTVYCNGSTTERAAIPAICVSVEAALKPVPTMGEWGVICLTLLLIIFAVMSLKEHQLGQEQYSKQ